MKHCDHCEKEFDTLETRCPVCGGELRENEDADEIVAIMPLIGLL